VCGELPAIFGRDEKLDLSDIFHVHLASSLETQARWSKISHQYYRTAKIDDPENDFWLIYAYDYFKDEYLLLTVIGPDAHNRSEWSSFLRTMHSDIVNPWIVGKLSYPDLNEI
jgi:mRNA interferase YafO